MARNFKHNYYLVNGNAKDAFGLNILINDEIRRDIKDISTIDLFTLNIKCDNSKKIIREFNKDTNLDNEFFIASYPHKNNTVETFPAIFDFDTEKSKKYIDGLKYFAKERESKYNNNQNINLNDDSKFHNYVYMLLYEIYKRNDQRLLSENSLLSYKLKEIIKNQNPNRGIQGNINSKIYILKNILSCYKQLRIVTYEHLLSIEGKNPNIRRKYSILEGADYEGLDIITPVKYKKDEKIHIEPEKQLTLDSFINDPNLLYDIKCLQKKNN